MQAYKLQGIVDELNNLILDAPLNVAPGQVEVIILQSSSAIAKTSEQSKKREYKVQALKDLLENAPPTPPEFDAEQAK